MAVETIDPFVQALDQLLKWNGVETMRHNSGGIMFFTPDDREPVPVLVSFRLMRSVEGSFMRGIVLESPAFEGLPGTDSVWNLRLVQLLNEMIFLKFSILPNKEAENAIVISRSSSQRARISPPRASCRPLSS